MKKIAAISARIERPPSRWLAFAAERRERALRRTAWIASPAMQFALRPFLRRLWTRHVWMQRIEPHLQLAVFSNPQSFAATQVDRRMTFSSRTSHTAHTSISPSTNLQTTMTFPRTLLQRHTTAPAPRIRTSLLIWPAPHHAAPSAIPSPQPPPIPMPAAVLRLTERATRMVETVAAPRQTARRSRLPVFAVPDVPQHHGFSPAPRAAAWPPPSTSATPAPVNVQDITDQVLRQIDRRVVASRERMGRI